MKVEPSPPAQKTRYHLRAGNKTDINVVQMLEQANQSDSRNLDSEHISQKKKYPSLTKNDTLERVKTSTFFSPKTSFNETTRTQAQTQNTTVKYAEQKPKFLDIKDMKRE